ncbi:MAG: NAD(P)H-binding protein [Thermodesulfovibrionales bacterium]
MIFIAGASGFVGSHLVDHLLSHGQSLTCLARSEKAVAALAAKGVAVVRGDITDPSSLKGAISSGDFIIHLVGIIEEKGDATFQRIHVDGTRNLVSEALRAGAGHFFYQSALGADRTSWSAYQRTKAEAEELVSRSGLPHTIFRPSLIIGPGDGFTKKILDMLRLSPVIPIPGSGAAKFQPIGIGDWLTCISYVIASPEHYPAIYELGGPEHLTYRKIVETLAQAAGLARRSVPVPMGLVKFGASLLEKVMSSPPVTPDQLRLLEEDNITRLDAVEENFGFRPRRFEEVVRGFVGKE